jgi:hypothetical protein
VQNEILINTTPGETRVAILEKNQFVELHLERARFRSVVRRRLRGEHREHRGGRRGAPRTSKPRAQRRGTPCSEHREPPPRGAGDRRPDRQGADREQGSTDHLPRVHRRPAPGAHSVGAAGGGVPAHRIGQGTTQAAGDREPHPAPGPGLHHSHRRRRHPGGRPGSGRPLSDRGLGRRTRCEPRKRSTENPLSRSG